MDKTLKGLSVSFRVDSGILEHNNREFCADNIDPRRISQNVIYKQEDLEQKYHELFDDALDEYNTKQTRSDRKIDDYFAHIMNSKQEKPFYEIIVQFGDKDTCGVGTENADIAKEMLDEYMRDFERRNPNMIVFNAVMHLDEATPHLHIDFIPISHSPKRGLPVKVSLKGALRKQGVVGKNPRETDRQVWGITEKEKLTEILRRHGFDRDIKNVHRPHLEVNEYKAFAAKMKNIKEYINVMKQKPTEELSTEEAAMINSQNDYLRGQVKKYESIIHDMMGKLHSKFVPFDIYSQEKLSFVCDELKEQNIPFVEESNCVYVPEYAQQTCAAIAARFKLIANTSIRDETMNDIDRFIYCSESLPALLDMLRKYGYEVKDGKFISVKSPAAKRFVRLKSLGEDYLPKSLEKRIAEKEKFPQRVEHYLQTTKNIKRTFFITINEEITAVRTLRCKPNKVLSDQPYSFENDSTINYLWKHLITISDFDLHSREDICRTAEKLQAELDTDTKELERTEATGERDKLKLQIGQNRENLQRVTELLNVYDTIIRGNYIDNLIAEQQKQSQTLDKTPKTRYNR